MKELDFDELDKAVNSIMKGGDAQQASDVSPVPDATPKDDVATPTGDSGGAATPATPPSSSTTPVSAPAPSRGRFMDVVRPTGDRPVRPLPQRPVDASSYTEQPEPAGDNTKPSITPDMLLSDVPTPGPVGELFNENSSIAAKEATATQASGQDDEGNSSEASINDTTMNSPFIADAKVEKRPLGGLVGDAVDPNAQAIDAAARSAAAELGDSDPGTPAPSPTLHHTEELDVNLMALESGSDTPAEIGAPVSAEAAAQAVAGATGQLNVQADTKQQAQGGAVFDTANYHQPIAHPAKKSSSMLWIIIGVVIVILGAAAGAAVYLLT